MKRKLAVLLLHPYLLCVLNLLILILLYSSIRVTWFDLKPANHFEEAVELWDGYGTILLGLGVFLEERVSLQRILGVEPNDGRKVEDLVEHVCHDYGVIFVLLGVVIELFAWLVKIPNEALDTYGVEFAFINISAATAAIGLFPQLKFLAAVLEAHFRGKSQKTAVRKQHKKHKA